MRTDPRHTKETCDKHEEETSSQIDSSRDSRNWFHRSILSSYQFVQDCNIISLTEGPKGEDNL